MDIRESYQILFAYHWHTNDRLMTCAAALTAEEYFAHPGYGPGSIHELLFHVLGTDHSWRRGLESGRQLPPLDLADYPLLESLRAGFREEQAAWQTLLDGLSPQEIEDNITLISRRGDPWTLPYWRILQHLILHGMQHHAELAQLLTAKGQSPGDIDFIFFGAR